MKEHSKQRELLLQRPSGLGKKQSVLSFIDCVEEFCLNSQNIGSHLGLLKQRSRRLTSPGLHFEKILLSAIWKTDGRMKSLTVNITFASEMLLK